MSFGLSNSTHVRFDSFARPPPSWRPFVTASNVYRIRPASWLKSLISMAASTECRRTGTFRVYDNIIVISQTYLHKFTDGNPFLRYPKSFSNWISSSCLNWYYRNSLCFILYLHVSSHSRKTADALDYPWVCIHHVRLIDSRCFINDSIDDTRSCNYLGLCAGAYSPKEFHFRNQQVRTIVWSYRLHEVYINLIIRVAW